MEGGEGTDGPRYGGGVRFLGMSSHYCVLGVILDPVFGTSSQNSVPGVILDPVFNLCYYIFVASSFFLFV